MRAGLAVIGVLVGWLGTAAAGDGPRQLVEVWKGERRMELREDGRVVRTFRIGLGGAPRLPKQRSGDLRTPEGRYVVAERLRNSRFHRFLGLNYPAIADADRGYAAGEIGADAWADIVLANLRGEMPPWDTPLGGRIGIHGVAGRPTGLDWTEGCIAVGDDEIEFLFTRLELGTPVVIHE